MKKKLAIGIAGAAAALIGGFKVVRQLVDQDDQAIRPTGQPGQPVNGGMRQGSSVPKQAEAAPKSGVSKDSSKAELYAIAQELGIGGRSKMSKQELLKAIEAAG